MNSAVCSEGKELDIIVQIINKFQRFGDRFLTTTNRIVDVMNLNSQQSCLFFINLAVKPWKGRNNNNHSKAFSKFMCSTNPLDQSFGDCIFYRNEKLIFYVYVLFGMEDQLNIGL